MHCLVFLDKLSGVYRTIPFLLMLLVAIAGCQTHTSIEPAQVIGVQYFAGGASKPLQAGDTANIQLWVDYIEAHNKRDFEQIAAMNAENFKGITPLGEVVRGSEAQAAFLRTWIEVEDPRWTVWWVIPNSGENEEGVVEEWLATGNIITTVGSDGSAKKSYETIDVLIENGKIRLLNVASQAMP